MFKKVERLTTAEFESYFKSGKRTHTKHLTLITAPHEKRKVSVVVGKKVAKRAVVRNKIRRRIYAQLRTELPATFTGVCIVLVKPSFVTLSRKLGHTVVSEAIAPLLKNT